MCVVYHKSLTYTETKCTCRGVIGMEKGDGETRTAVGVTAMVPPVTTVGMTTMAAPVIVTGRIIPRPVIIAGRPAPAGCPPTHWHRPSPSSPLVLIV